MGYLRHLGGCFGRCWLEEGCPGGALLSIWSNELAKNYRRQLLFYVVGLFGMLLGAQVGSKRPSWLHLGRLGLDFWSLWVDFGSIFWLLVAWAAFQKTLKKPFVFKGFLMFWGVGWAT